MKKTLLLIAFFTTIVSNAQNLITQNFDDITTLEPSGWIFSNLANNVGATTWFQGTETVFVANSGATTSYIGANFNSITGSGRISTWLFTPILTGLQNGDIISFYTRTTINPATFPDRLELRISTDATEVMPNAPNNVGSFTTLALSVNSALNTTDYPAEWTQYSYTITGLTGPTDSRIALRYHVQQGGPSGVNSNYIGIDDFSVDRPALGIRDFFANNFSLQPNPVKDIFSVTSKNNATIENVSVIDINGRIVKEIKVSTIDAVQINIADLNAGVYFVKVKTGLGVGTSKIIKN
ncbi:choice-of-anchor J domain-containing protein [Flavobacterium paronense]|uniref:T9SS-dependent choice-of-anchor J family protein n=1 Tax=Flavobacterium paronense TaxID=1392775 RepID=A0ABV5GDQ4_9FLAO|nr:choice-of-anchor J domain-containing protein [Flavobacterium paronense]MDN3678036.1 choice-of-anchor J domain-containing protein [Flavobacterium paronense]